MRNSKVKSKVERDVLNDDKNAKLVMEDMVIHECVFDVCKVLNNNQSTALSDDLYNFLHIILNPQYSYNQKTKKIKG